jgi:hypothetical protein
MTNLLTFILIAYGASNIMVFSSIFKKWRVFFGTDDEQPSFFGKLFGCMMCLPFWWGVIISLLMYSPSFAMVDDIPVTIFGFDIPTKYLATFFDGCLASGTVWFVHTLQEKLES